MMHSEKKDYAKIYSLDEIARSEIDKIVAVEPLDDGTGIVFTRDDDKVSSQKIGFRPFLLLSAPVFLDNFSGDFAIEKLKGNGVFSFIAKFADSKIYDKAVKHLKDSTGINPSSPKSPFRVFTDPSQQFLTSNRIRLFRGMTFREIRRMQIDIETILTDGYEFPNPEREGDAISLISMSDSTGWEKSIMLNHPHSEKELLEEFVRTVMERDPDVIEGHNIFRFDLTYIETRAKRFKVKLALGRDKSIISTRPSRISIAERTISYKRFDIFGRHVIDTYHLVQLYDVSHRDLTDYGLKSVARHFGVAADNRTYLDCEKITETFRKSPETVKKYGLDDVRETRAISDILSTSFFYQAQLIPYSYQNCLARGNATRIDALLVAAYLADGASIPAPEGDKMFSGALTEAFHSGTFKNVWHCDVRSLYPSIILSEKWCPSRDYLGIFPAFLEKLRNFRFTAKNAEKKSSDQQEKDFHNSIQTTFKILINSFYGYLGFSQGTFNDYAMAEGVTSKGREILSTMVNFLEKSGAKVIEIDTDGIYFQPPENEKNPEALEKKIQSVLPEGIDVELDETYPSMFCYKSKNYALLKQDGEVAITGAALKSRGLEPFQRDYMSEFIRHLLADDSTAIEKLTQEYRDAIEKRKWPVAKFAKSETLSDSLDAYKRKLADGSGKRSAAYELAIASGRDYRQGDQVSFYVTGTKKNLSVVENSRLIKDVPAERDENTTYYLSKLDELYKKFSVFIENGGSKDEIAPQMTELGFEI